MLSQLFANMNVWIVGVQQEDDESTNLARLISEFLRRLEADKKLGKVVATRQVKKMRDPSFACNWETIMGERVAVGTVVTNNRGGGHFETTEGVTVVPRSGLGAVMPQMFTLVAPHHVELSEGAEWHDELVFPKGVEVSTVLPSQVKGWLAVGCSSGGIDPRCTVVRDLFEGNSSGAEVVCSEQVLTGGKVETQKLIKRENALLSLIKRVNKEELAGVPYAIVEREGGGGELFFSRDSLLCSLAGEGDPVSRSYARRVLLPKRVSFAFPHYFSNVQLSPRDANPLLANSEPEGRGRFQFWGANHLAVFRTADGKFEWDTRGDGWYACSEDVPKIEDKEVLFRSYCPTPLETRNAWLEVHFFETSGGGGLSHKLFEEVFALKE